MEKAEKERIESVLKYTLSMDSLNDTERQGYVDWNVKRKRRESVGEHSYSTIPLAIAIWSEFNLPINIDRVIAILSVHETEEPIIGDLPLVSDLKQYKKEIGKIAVNAMTECLNKNDYVLGLIKEFEEGKTPEAKYAKYCDKLQCDIKAKYYDEEGIIDLTDQEGNPNFHHSLVQELLNEGKSFGEMWMEFGRIVYNYPEEFNKISEYAENNNLHEIRDNHMNKGKEKVKNYLDDVRKQANK